jgi:hypothetical protein
MLQKRLHQGPGIKPKRKAAEINREHSKLDAPTEECQHVPTDESRRHVPGPAGRALGQGVRSQRLFQGEQDSNSDRHLEAARLDRRGATR